MRKIFAIGEIVYDIIFKNGIPQRANPGGAMLNTSISLGRCGLPVHFIGELGSDKLSEIITDFLAQNNVLSNYIVKYPQRKTAIALAFLDNNNDASYSFYKDYPAQRLIAFPEINKDDIVLFGSSFALNQEIRPKLLDFLTQAKERKAIIIYDPNFRKQNLEKEKLVSLVEENISYATIVRGSDEDFLNVFQREDSYSLYRIISNLGCNNVVITRNKQAVSIITKFGENTYPVKDFQPVSTIGAGDNFNAGLIYGICKHSIYFNNIKNLTKAEWQKLVNFGIDFASQVCLSFDNYIDKEFITTFDYLSK